MDVVRCIGLGSKWFPKVDLLMVVFCDAFDVIHNWLGGYSVDVRGFRALGGY